MTHKKLTEYPKQGDEHGCVNCVFLGAKVAPGYWECNKHGYYLNGLDRLCEEWEGHNNLEEGDIHLIPAPVCDAASNALDYLGDALGNACDGCEWKMSRHINEETGKVSCMQKPECVIARGYAALHKYQEVSKGEVKKPE